MGFGPAGPIAAAETVPVIRIIMNNNAYGTIAGLQMANFGLLHGTTFPKAASPLEQKPDHAAIASNRPMGMQMFESNH